MELEDVTEVEQQETPEIMAVDNDGADDDKLALEEQNLAQQAGNTENYARLEFRMMSLKNA